MTAPTKTPRPDRARAKDLLTPLWPDGTDRILSSSRSEAREAWSPLRPFRLGLGLGLLLVGLVPVEALSDDFGPDDFFAVLRPCFGASIATQPECIDADLDGDGVVGPSDFFAGFRPSLDPAPDEDFDLLLSFAPTRTGAAPLDGASVSGDVYIFLAPEYGVKQVRFWLDRPARDTSPREVELVAPFDFAGGSEAKAQPFDTATLTAGTHRIDAEVDLVDGRQVVVTQSFEVTSGSAGEPEEPDGGSDPDDRPPDDTTYGGPADFNGYRGPDRNGIARADVGLADDWSSLPGGRPELLWQTGDLGVIGVDHTNGQVAVWDDKAYAVTYLGGQRTVFAFDERGREMWRKTLLTAYSGTHSANPSVWVEDGRVYIHDDRFDYCLDALTGRELWKTARSGDHKSSPIVIDGVYVMRSGGYVGKDALTGETLWNIPSCSGTNGGGVGSAMMWQTPSKSYALLQYDENNCILLVDPETGKRIWKVDPPAPGGDGAPNTSPLIYQDRLVLTTRDLGTDRPQLIYEVFPDTPSRTPRLIYAGGEERVKGSPVIHQGHVFWGYTSRHNGYAKAMDVKAGRPKYYDADPQGIRTCVKGYNDLLVADGKLYGTGCLQSTLARPTPDRFDLVSVFNNNANHQTTPTIVGGRMYVYSYDGYRQGGERKTRIKAFDVAAPSGAEPTITQRELPDGVVGGWYEQRLWVSGGNGLRTWSVAGGSLPKGLVLDANTHMLTGRPQKAGIFSVTLRVRDADGDSDRKTFTLTVDP